MILSPRRAELHDVEHLRELYRREADCQIVRYTNLPRGFAYAVALGGGPQPDAYGSIRTSEDEHALIEFFVHPDHRPRLVELAAELLRWSRVPLIEAQTNIPWLLEIAERFGTDPIEGPTLFAEDHDAGLKLPGARFRKREPADVLFEHTSEPEGDWVVEHAGEVVATGGYFTHYNPPYADIYMEVKPWARRRGFGSFLVQEVQKVCRADGFIAAARCDPSNAASAACLQRAGMRICGRISTARTDFARL